MQQVAPASNRPVCNEVQEQVTSVCVTSTGSLGLGSGCTQPAMRGSGCVCVPTGSHIGQSSGEVAGPPLPQSHSDCSRVAKHALVLGSSGHVKPDSPEPAQSSNTALQSDSHRNLTNLNLHAWLLEPQLSKSGASLRQWQHELRLLKEDQPDQSMRQSGPFLQSGASVTTWTSGHPL